MRYNTFNHLWEDMLDDSDDVFIVSNSKHSALLSTRDGVTFLLRGDFSGTPEECEAEARRIIGNQTGGKSGLHRS
jgi:hypothetical protein